MRWLTIVGALVAAIALAAACEDVTGTCESYSGGMDFYADLCPDGARYELLCSEAEAVDGQRFTDCQCLRNGRFGRSFPLETSIPSSVPEAVRLVNRECDWDVPPP